jgi:deoxycytidylate deaminase
MDWQHYMRLAYAEAAKSRDWSTQIGTLLVDPTTGGVLTAGHNDIPAGCADHPDRRVRPLKYEWVEHAEQAAIHAAAKRGVPTAGLHMYATWAACGPCGSAIVASGIRRLYRHMAPVQKTRSDWAASLVVADTMFAEAGVEVVNCEGELGVEFRFNGELVRV